MAPQPKVKGTKKNSNSRNKDENIAITETLGRVAATLKERQSTTKKQIAVAEKIKVILERESLLPDEVDRLVREAEEAFQRP
jgi:hypothetical protein